MALVRPTPFGGHNWQPMSFHPGTGLVYIPAQEIQGAFRIDERYRFRPGRWNTGADNELFATLTREIASGHLLAWDPVAQREAWRHPYALPWNGGTLATAGNLVFQGTADGRFLALSADAGRKLWEDHTGTGVIAAPITWSLDGVQYVTVVAGWGGAFALASGVPRHRGNKLTEGRIYTFKLGADTTLPEPQVAFLELPEPPDVEYTPAQVASGEKLYHTYCAVCHGPGAVSSGGGTPDLRYSSADVHDSWNAIVLQGAFTGKGMVGFDHVMNEDDSKAVQAYVISQTRGSIALCRSEYRENYPEVIGNACIRAQPETQAAGR